ncbi:MAG: M28 family peptidase [Deltaproteobacteria bacterium]|nr:M28 family peptidase [Deltaproteobacteria bacterium]
MTGVARQGASRDAAAAVPAEQVITPAVLAEQVITPAVPAEQVITPAVLAAPIRLLADDALEGRGPGTRGDQLARLYLASTLALLGLDPAFPGGSYEQPVDLLGVVTRAPAIWTFRAGARRMALEDGTDFVASSGIAAARAAVRDAEIVFAGYGIEAPEFGWDDFKGKDLRGRVLLLLNDDPDWDPELFAGPRRLYYGRWTYKFESAARQGAVGAILLHTPKSAGYPWQTVRTSWSGENSRLAEVPQGRGLVVEAWITDDAARRLAALAGHDLDALVAAARSRAFAPVSLGVTTSLVLDNEVRRYATANVGGLLRGGDPELADEVVVFSAHHDHFGVKPSPDGRREIYNGALDNAAGVAQVLAIARAFTALPERPRRSILFLALAAEEQGLLGSEYFVKHAPVPLSRLVANLNVDGGNVFGRTTDVGVVGLGKSSLDEHLAAAAQAQGRSVAGDPFPDRGMFYRSDQFNFARSGVPALFPRAGVLYVGRPPDWGRERVDAWIERNYHQPSDDWDPAWDLTGMVDDARLLFRAGLSVADADVAPAWLPGDEFAPARPAANGATR